MSGAGDVSGRSAGAGSSAISGVDLPVARADGDGSGTLWHVSLPMYDLAVPAVRHATDVWWACVASHAGAALGGSITVPHTLDRATALSDVLAPAHHNHGATAASESSEPFAPPVATKAGPLTGLLLSQTCGYPLCRCEPIRSGVRVVATPCYGPVPGCDGPRYSSAIVVRDSHGLPARATAGTSAADDGPSNDDVANGAAAAAVAIAGLRGCVAAVNSFDSLSGCVMLLAAVAACLPPSTRATTGTSTGEGDSDLDTGVRPGDDGALDAPFFSAVIETGAHVASLRAVQSGDADVAAIDAVTLALVRRYDPAAVAGLTVLTYSPSAPALPFVTAADQPDAVVERLRSALRAAAAADSGGGGDDRGRAAAREARDALLILGAEVVPREEYEAAVEALCGSAGSVRLPPGTPAMPVSPPVP